MTKICFCDLDGVVVNNEERAKKARQGSKGRQGFYDLLFKPEWVQLDTLVPGAVEALQRLVEKGYAIIFLSSRPESMADATVAWLAWHGLAFQVLLRPQYARTIEWKPQQVKEYVKREEPESVLVIDDSEDVREAMALLDLPHTMVKYSLQDALETDLEHHPVLDGGSELLRRLQEICNAACVRERFEHDAQFLLRVVHPPNDRGEMGMPLEIRTNIKNGERFVIMTEIWNIRDEEIEALTIAMNSQGEAIDVVIADVPLNGEGEVIYSRPLEGDPEKLNGYADWKAHNLQEFGYVDAARLRRDRELYEFRAYRAYHEAMEERARVIQEALKGGNQ